jgi:hypothetical protein
MANALYAKAKKAFLDADIDLLADNIKVCLIDAADYTVDLTNHDFLDDVAGAAIVATSGNLAGKSTTGGVFDADDVTFTAVTGDPCEALIIYKDSGAAATSNLIAYIDTATGLPVTPAGTDIPVVWSSGASKIFAL